jgi:hypothetical protein
LQSSSIGLKLRYFSYSSPLSSIMMRSLATSPSSAYLWRVVHLCWCSSIESRVTSSPLWRFCCQPQRCYMCSPGCKRPQRVSRSRHWKPHGRRTLSSWARVGIVSTQRRRRDFPIRTYHSF